MIQTKNITKQYKTGTLIQKALNGVSINFRENEFVAIMGASGSGKTTLLNIIGGLDRYDTGDLIINNVSTNDYKESDWDIYRNHTIGFIFQSRNLISHRTILSNVELALIIGGVQKKERKRRALLALDEVGLKDQAHKKPSQLSGGQMQRVSIARALINNPDILLADEPTASLDVKTSEQIMDLLKEVAKDRLVVMITHDLELANKYANRIIKLQDGKVESDSNPFDIEETKLRKKTTHTKKAHMSFLTALSLSFSNLLTKKGRTILTALTGSLGVIGIAFILSISNGFQNYIHKTQKETLSNYPLTITSDFADATSAILSIGSEEKGNIASGENIIEKQYLTTAFPVVSKNDLKSLKSFIENNQDRIDECTSQIRYSYSVVPQIYTIDASDRLIKLYPNSTLSISSNIFSEMPDDVGSIKGQYDLLKGRWPKEYNELVIVLSEPNSIPDLLTYSLGLRDTSELKTIITKAEVGEEASIKNDPLKLTYDELMNVELKLIRAADTYKFNQEYYIYEDMKNDEEYMKKIYDNSLKLKIVGIVCPSEEATGELSVGVHYTESLTKYVISQAYNTPIVQNQLRNKEIDVFSLKRFDDKNDEKIQVDFKDMVSIDEKLIKDAVKINPDADALNINQDAIKNKVSEYTTNMISSLTVDITPAKQDFENTLSTLCKNYIKDYITTYQQSGMIEFTDENKTTFNPIFLASNSFSNPISSLVNKYPMPSGSTSQLKMIYQGYTLGIFDAMKTSFPSPILVAVITDDSINTAVSTYITTVKSAPTDPSYDDAVTPIASGMTVAAMGNAIGKNVENITKTCLDPLTTVINAFDNSEDLITIDANKYSQAIKFDMDQDELSRIISSVSEGSKDKTYKNNLVSLGYQDVDEPTSISFYFKDSESKEKFMTILDEYNEDFDDENKIKYSDISGILMSSVNTIADNITSVLVVFVFISLIIPAFMIAIITLISVMERKKEIGILRAMGASKNNISSIFNAEIITMSVLSSLIGIAIAQILIPLINTLIHDATNNYGINASLPVYQAIALVIVFIFLTTITGIIPSRKAAKQDLVTALKPR